MNCINIGERVKEATISSGLRLLAAACFAFITVNAGACTRVQSRTNVVSLTGLQMPEHGKIVGFDLATDSNGRIHLSWHQRVTQDAHGGYSTWYRRADKAARVWSTPLQLLQGDLEPPRILVGNRTLHLISGEHLRHLVSADGGENWKELARLIPVDDSLRCLAFKYDAAIIDDSTVVVAYLGYTRPNQLSGPGPSFDLKIAFINGQSSLLLGRFPLNLDLQALPKLVYTDSLLTLLCTTNADRSQANKNPDGVTNVQIRGAGDIMLFQSRDQGRTWTQPASIPRPTAHDVWQPIHQVKVLDANGSLYALFNSVGNVHAVSISPAGWGPRPQWLPGPNVILADLNDSRTFDCGSFDGHSFIVWASRDTARSGWALNDEYTQMNYSRVVSRDDSLVLETSGSLSDQAEHIRALRFLSTSRGPAIVWSGRGINGSSSAREAYGMAQWVFGAGSAAAIAR